MKLWKPARTAPEITAGEIHVFRVVADPLEGAGRAPDPHPRPRTPVQFDLHVFNGTNQSMLRRVVGWLLGCPPPAVRLRRDRYGRHVVPDADLEVGISRSGSRLLVAVTRGVPVATGVHAVPSVVDEVMWRPMTRPETRRITRRPADEWAVALARAWTRKDAAARLLGLSPATEGIHTYGLDAAGPIVVPDPAEQGGVILWGYDLPADDEVVAAAVSVTPMGAVRTWTVNPVCWAEQADVSGQAGAFV